MVKPRPRSVQEYEERVGRSVQTLRDSWLAQLKKELHSETTLRSERVYWTTLIAMAHLDWSGEDADVEQALREGLRRYGDESDSSRDAPPSAAYLWANPEGKIVYRYLVAEDLLPMRLLQTHIEIVEEKQAILALVNQFAAAALLRGTPQRAHKADAHSNISPLGTNLGVLRDELLELKLLLGGIESRIPGVRVRPTHDQSWLFEPLNQAPIHLREHEAIQLMRSRIEVMRATRQKLESLRAAIERVASDDTPDVINAALRAIGSLLDLDPDDTYRVVKPIAGSPQQSHTLRLAWQQRDVPLLPLSALQAELVKIQAEQQRLQQAMSWLTNQLHALVGPLLDDDALAANAHVWQHIANRSLSAQVLALWDYVVSAGRAGELETMLGGYVLRLEQGRRKGLFKPGMPEHVPQLLQYMLRDVPHDHHITVDEHVASVAEYVELWYERASSWEPLSLISLQYLIGKLIAPLREGAARRSRQDGSALVTLSSTTADNLKRLVTLHERLTTVIEWVRDYERNYASWDTELWNLYNYQIPRTRDQDAKAILKQKLKRISPDFPYAQGFASEEIRPSLPNRGSP